MTLEEKAKAYDEALEKAKKLCGYPTVQPFLRDLQDLFPELAESKDEKIRKMLIEICKRALPAIFENYGSSKEDALAWLEKQGEQNSIMNVPSREIILSIWDLGNEWKELTKGSISTEYGTQLDYIQKHWQESEYYLRAKQGKQKPYGQRAECLDCQFNYAGECKGSCAMKRGEQKSADKVEPKFKVGDIVQYKTDSADRRRIEEVDELCNMYHTINDSPIMFKVEDEWEVVENAKDAEETSIIEWSKEDEKCIRLSTDIINSALRAGFCVQLDRDRCVDWLKSLKDRVHPQPKQAWNEEDEKMLERLIQYFEHKECFIAEDDIAYSIWLKSLRPHKHWEPSDEQMNAFEQVYNWYNNNFAPSETLTSLYNDLKKLKS